MAVKKLKVKLSLIAKEIDRAKKQLEAIRSKVSSRDRKRLSLDIKDLNKARALVARQCKDKKMTASFGSGA
jgi:hypothetical protein